MAKIVYGVSGEGSGHTSRALAVIPHLLEQGHDVKVVGYDRSYRDLADRFDVFETEGLTIGQSDNAVSIIRTIKENFARVPRGHRKSRELKDTLFKGFRPEAVITDFEPMTAYLANYYKVPLITLDNQHRMRYLDLTVPPGMTAGIHMTRAIIRAMIPRPDVSLVTTFHFSPVTNDHTFTVPPIIRPEVRAITPRQGEHIIVYFTKKYDSFLKKLQKFERERFFVYGQGREEEAGNVVFKAFSREGFLEDLATCKAIVASAGFTLITESLHLGKPYLALPTRGQWEQELNAFMLDKMGYGKGCFKVSHESVKEFLDHIPVYKERLEDYPASDGTEIMGKLDELLADGCALAREFHEKRKRSV